MKSVPIALFVYARPRHTLLTVTALLKNTGAELSDLIIFSDAARTPDRHSAVDEVRDYLKTITGFRSVTIHHRSHNFGLAKSIIEGVTEVLKVHERVIVLEDDIVTSPYFLTYMNEALEKYAYDDRVVSIHGYVYPVGQPLPEAFFLRGADCWGWATWSRGWSCFNSDGKFLLNELRRKKLINEFNFNGEYSFSSMLNDQINGRNDSWAVRWHASAFLANKLTLHPGRSLVHNIGNDGSGTHCDTTDQCDSVLSQIAINLQGVEVQSSKEGYLAFEEYYRRHKMNLLRRVVRRVLLFKKYIRAYL